MARHWALGFSRKNFASYLSCIYPWFSPKGKQNRSRCFEWYLNCKEAGQPKTLLCWNLYSLLKSIWCSKRWKESSCQKKNSMENEAHVKEKKFLLPCVCKQNTRPRQRTLHVMEWNPQSRGHTSLLGPSIKFGKQPYLFSGHWPRKTPSSMHKSSRSMGFWSQPNPDLKPASWPSLLWGPGKWVRSRSPHVLLCKTGPTIVSSHGCWKD